MNLGLPGALAVLFTSEPAQDQLISSFQIMDALSGVASLIAVVSLSLQLIQSAHATRSFAQRVKSAPVELLRLTQSLEHLEALLEDVRQLIERQMSLQQTLDSINRSLLVCLRSCEKSIDPLRTIIERYRHAQSQTRRFQAKLRSDISLGLKAKDILKLERAIDREIDRLSAALIINGTNIQYVTFYLL